MNFVQRYFKNRREKKMAQTIFNVLSSKPDAESYRNAGMPEDMIQDALSGDQWLADARAENKERMLHDKNYAKKIESARLHFRQEEIVRMGGCPVCRKPIEEHSGKWCACPTCNKPFGPDHCCKAGDYVPVSVEHPDGKIPFGLS